jgi:copper(I)-binding protein
MHALKQALFLNLFLGLIFALIACTPEEPRLDITDVWSRSSAPTALNSAFYMIISNEGSEPDALVSAESNVCGEIQLHESEIDDQGVMTMRQQSEINIPPGGTVVLQVGGLHLMCLDRQIDFVSGETVPLTLDFETAGESDVLAEIRDE